MASAADRVYLLVLSRTGASILSFARTGFADRRTDVELSGAVYQSSGAVTFVVDGSDLYYNQRDELRRLRLTDGQDSLLGSSPVGWIQSLTSDASAIYWVGGGRVFLGDTDPMVWHGIARVARAGGEPHILWKTPCRAIAASETGMWCVTSVGLRADNTIAGVDGNLVKLSDAGEPGLPLFTNLASFAVGEKFVFVSGYSWGVAALAPSADPPALPVAAAPIEAPMLLTTNGVSAFYTAAAESTWSVFSFRP
jgi:hypothetical protein